MQQRGQDIETKMHPTQADNVWRFELGWNEFNISNIDLLLPVSQFPEPNSEFDITHSSSGLDSSIEVVTAPEYSFYDGTTSTPSIRPMGFLFENPVVQSTFTADVRQKPKRLISS
jgi:hypothetical protein